MTRVKQQGSVIGYVMVGLILAALVVGGIYVTRTQLSERLVGGPNIEQAADDAADTVEETVTSDEGATDDEQDLAEPDPVPVDEPATEPADEPATDTDEPATDEASDDSQAVVDAPVESEDERMAQTGVDTSQSDSLPTTGMELPQTGVGDLLVSAFPLAAVIGAVIAYRRSNML